MKPPGLVRLLKVEVVEMEEVGGVQSMIVREGSMLGTEAMAVGPAAPTSVPQLPPEAWVPGSMTTSKERDATAAAASAADILAHGEIQPPQATSEDVEVEDEAGETNVMLDLDLTLSGYMGPSDCAERTMTAVTEVIRNATAAEVMLTAKL
jgi:hypothetical protein